MNYEDPGSETLHLIVVKLPALIPTARQGAIVWQFGGPGEITSDYLVTAAESEGPILGELQEHFDIVVADPRGIGMNYPVKCDLAYGKQKVSYYPKTEKEYDDALSYFEGFGQSCLERTGDVLNYMDTLTQAKDLEAVRILIGEGKLNYCKYTSRLKCSNMS